MIVTDIISCTASVATAIIAGMALYAWKREFIGKKKIELAAEIMRAVYDIQDMYIGARLQMIAKTEIDEAYQWINSQKEMYPSKVDIYPERLKYLVPHQRLLKQQSVIDNFRKLQNQAYMYWGKEIMVAFLKLTDYNWKIMRASLDLYYGQDTPEYKPLYDLICCEKENDQVNTDINNIVEAFRRNLEPLYIDKQSKWHKG